MNINGNGPIKVATYSRVSTQEQALEGTSLEFQESQLTAYCQLQGMIELRLMASSLSNL